MIVYFGGDEIGPLRLASVSQSCELQEDSRVYVILNVQFPFPFFYV